MKEKEKREKMCFANVRLFWITSLAEVLEYKCKKHKTITLNPMKQYSSDYVVASMSGCHTVGVLVVNRAFLNVTSYLQ